MRRVWVSLGLVLGGAPVARADGLAVVGGSPRAIGRAGASTVGDDGGGALLVNPAALARRESTRIQLGVAFVDDALAWDPDHPEAPIAQGQAGSSTMPLAAIVGALGPWVIGAGVMTAGVSERALRDPRDVPDPGGFDALFEYRYAGIAGAIRRDTVTLGVARRLGDAVAFGLSAGASRVTLRETRRLWAGQFPSITPAGEPTRDVQLALAGTDGFVPSVVAGLLVAPVEAPMELAASIGWTARTEIEADVLATVAQGAPVLAASSPRATLAFRQPLAARLGARYLSDRFVVELGGDLWISPHASREAAWRIAGLRVRDPLEPSGSTVAIRAVPSRLSQRTHGSLRGALDVELIAGFLWATAGYAYTVGGTTEGRLSPSLASLGGHTFALGIEGTAGGFTYTIGWSRTLASARRGGDALRLDNPFGTGDAVVPAGRYDGSADQLGVLLDLELGAR